MRGSRREQSRFKWTARQKGKNRRQLRNKSIEISKCGAKMSRIKRRYTKSLKPRRVSLRSRLLADRKVFLIWPFRLLSGLPLDLPPPPPLAPPPLPRLFPLSRTSTEDINNAGSKVSLRFKVFLSLIPSLFPPVPPSLSYIFYSSRPIALRAMNFAEKMTNERPREEANERASERVWPAA